MMLVYRLEGIGSLNQTYNSLTGKMRIFAQYVFSRSGPMGSGATPLGIFVRSDNSHDRANLAYTILPYSRKSAGLKTEFHSHPGVTLSVYDCRPTSRGNIKLTGAEMADSPDIRFNYLATDHDRRVAIDAMRFTRKLMQQPAVAPFKPVELRPGLQDGDDDNALLDAFRAGATTIFHPVGTAKMGRGEDARAVVDSRLRVIGLDALRVIDASVMPTVTSGNTNAPTMMIAEKGAEMILQDAAATRAA
jgi:choline dehydrogenase-like flavoprotein